MYFLKISSLLFGVGLSTSSLLAVNTSQALTLTLNITDTNNYEYLIPGVNPTVTLMFSHLNPDRVTPVDASSVYMCAVENLGRICRRSPRNTEVWRPEILAYGAATIRIESSKKAPGFTYNSACAVLRGLAEYMTVNRWWAECSVDVVVEGTVVGNALVWNPESEAEVASIATT